MAELTTKTCAGERFYGEDFPSAWPTLAPREQQVCVVWQFKGETESGGKYRVEHMGCGVKGLTCEQMKKSTQDKRATCLES